jgi:hypothetical protein
MVENIIPNLSDRKSRFSSRSVYYKFLKERMSLEQVSFRILGFFPLHHDSTNSPFRYPDII